MRRAPEALLAASRGLGEAAFKAGIACAPAQDLAMTKLLRESAKGWSPKACIELLDAWHNGWATANVAEPIAGWTAEENAAIARNRSGDHHE